MVELWLAERGSEAYIEGMEMMTDSAAPPPPPLADSTPFSLSDSAAKRIAHLLKDEPGENPKLRISVLGGGCSGFQYHYDFDAKPINSDDVLIEQHGAIVVVDSVSLDLLKGSMMDYVETLGAASFEIKNPNATASCGCGNSFAIG